jgi:hypothetical protein
LFPGPVRPVTAAHLVRAALLYVRQSTLKQVIHDAESTHRQYDLRGRVIALGWSDVLRRRRSVRPA